MKELDFLFLLAVICFISTILVIISFFSCYFKQRTAPQLNIANINHQSIDSGFGKLNQFFEFKLLHFILYNCFIYFFLDEWNRNNNKINDEDQQQRQENKRILERFR